MQDLSLEMAKAVRRFEPIETEGLTLYPIQVKDIDEFTTARPAIEFMQQSLPVAMLSKPLLQAYYTLELDAAKIGQPGSGLFYKCILFLLLAMRVGNGLPSEKRIELVDLELQANDPTRLKSVLIFVNGEVTATVTNKMELQDNKQKGKRYLKIIEVEFLENVK